MLSNVSTIAVVYCASIFFFFNDTATTEIYTLSLHDALPISKSPAIENRSNLLKDALQTGLN